MNEWIMLFVGGGGIIGAIATLLTFFSKHRGSRIDWYDRAIKDNDKLRDEIQTMRKEMEEKNAELAEYKSKFWKLRIAVNRLKIENKELKLKVKELTQRLLKGKEEE